MASRLTKQTLDFIKANDVTMYGPLSVVLNTKVSSIEKYIERNSRRLTELPVLKVIADYTGKQPEDLIEEYDDSTELSNKVESISE